MNVHLRLGLALAACLVVQACSDLGSLPQDTPACAQSTSSLDFGQVAVGESLDASFLLRNQGSTTLEGPLASDSPDFVLVDPAGTYLLQAGESLEVAVRFTPTAQGPESCTITTGTVCGEVQCVGEGAVPTPGASCTVTPASLAFGSVAVGSSADRSFVIVNDGPVAFGGAVSATCSDFTVVSGAGSFTLAAGESLTAVVRYAPTVVGLASCTVRTGIDCSDVPASGEGSAPVSNVSFSSDVQPIFTASCATMGCHRTPNPQAALNLLQGQSWSQLVNVTSQGYAPALRVVPGDPDGSVLYNKIADTGRFGARMPENGVLTAGEIDLIRQWIQDGAPNN